MVLVLSLKHIAAEAWAEEARSSLDLSNDLMGRSRLVTFPI